MAVAVESVSTAAYGASPISITKPTGLAEGELLLAVIFTNASGGTVTPASGFTHYTAINSGNLGTGNAGIRLYTKVATSGDVAASNFSFSTTSGSIAGTMYRISGSETSIPIFNGGRYSEAAGDGTVTGSVSVTIPGSNHLLIFLAAVDDDSTNTTFSGYTITGGTNPTWTERQDLQIATNDVSQAVADAIYASDTDITALTVTTSDSDPALAAISVVTIVSPQDVAGTTTLLEATPILFEPSGAAGVSANVSLLTATPQLFEPSGTTTNNPWTNESKPSTTWTNESKS